MNEVFYNLASHICGQVNVWNVGGHALPLCQRCTGLYAGAALAAALLAWLRPALTRWMFVVHATMIVAMIPLGYHVVSQSADVRTVSGFAYGVGLVYFLSVANRNPKTRASTWVPHAYVGSLLLCAAVLLVVLHAGAERGARAIILLDVAGFATLFVMTVQAIISFFREPAVTAA